MRNAEHTGKYYTFTDVQHSDTSWRAAKHTTSPTDIGNAGSAAANTRQAQGTTSAAASEPVYVEAHVIDDRRGPWAPSQQPGASATDSPGGGRIAGAAQTVLGLGIAAVGVPMLILPGPGLLAVVGGLLVAGNGAKKVLFGKKK